MSSADLRIRKVFAREILDSRGNPTVEVDLQTAKSSGRADVPSGASTGTHEALEIRDGDKARYNGKGVLKAVRNVSEVIGPKVIGLDATKQQEIDRLMIKLDGTPNKTNLGANAILGVSLAAAKAAANGLGEPLYKYLGGGGARILPVPMMNVINGGKHAGSELSIQEFMILPVGADRFSEALRIGAEVYQNLKKFLTEKYGRGAINVGDEGGFAPPMKTVREALEALSKAVDMAGYELGVDVVLAMDAAASEFFDEKSKTYRIDGDRLDSGKLIVLYKKLVEEYPVKSIEDPLQEEDFAGLAAITKEIGKTVQIVGDDIFVTNVKRLQRGIDQGAANALLLKVNQIGTLTEAIEAAELCFRNNYRVVVSHRSGETEDTTIADLAVALGTGQIKTGAPARAERTAKYNQLLRIEENLGSSAKYLGIKALAGQ
ncbi:MAG: phosphopyruvate hydratase [Thaumarchaeota archaeon]|nr:phosphopyruvate hydratase [Nitrososphaerota archaeon]